MPNFPVGYGGAGSPWPYDGNNRLLPTFSGCLAPNGALYDAAGNLQCQGAAGVDAQTYLYDAESRIAQTSDQYGNHLATYTYDANGARVRKALPSQTFTEYSYFNGQPLSEKDQTGNWTDYIYANGAKITRAPATENVLTISGTNIGSGDYNWFPVNGNGGLSSYTVGAGDALVVRQRQHRVAVGNGAVQFNTDQAVSAVRQLGPDTDGQPAANDGTGDNIWHRRVFDMSPMAGNHMVGLYVGVPQSAAPGAWSVEYADMMLYSAASGTWIPLLTETHPVSLSTWSGSFTGGYTANLGWGMVPVATVPGTSEHYYLSDNLGTTQMEFAGGGWPLWRGQFTPFGAELPDGNTTMHYKFTGKERDSESGLDYFKYRDYGSNLGRWMSPDPSGLTHADLGNPQSLNLYNYVGNSPLTRVDLDGLCWKGFQWACNTAQRFKNSLDYGFVTDKQRDALIQEGRENLQRHGLSAEGLSRVGIAAAAGKFGRTWQSYIKRHPNLGTYSGRTSGTDTPEQNLRVRDAKHNELNNQGYDKAELDRSSSNPDAIRGREQQLIDQNGGAQSQGGTSANKINGISNSNPNKETFMQAAEAETNASETTSLTEEIIVVISTDPPN